MYLANYTRPDISFSVNLLSRYSFSPTQRHWNEVKHVLRYLQGTMNMGLFYPKIPKLELIGYADAGYLSDPHHGRSQTGYLFTSGDTTISWRSVKQTITATSSNHAELLALHEASRECVWLRSMIQHIQKNCGLSSGRMDATIIYEGDRTKHISPKFFFTHDLQKNGDINIQQIQSCDNLADVFTKSLPSKVFEKLVLRICLRRLRDICFHEGEK